MDGIEKIFELAQKISTERKADVFVDYNGHINGMSIRIYREGWRKDNVADHWFRFLIDNFDEDEIKPSYVISFLQEILDGNDYMIEIGNLAYIRK